MACVWYRRTRDARFLDRARQAAAFLLRTSQPAVRGPSDGRIYSFDTGILATGLLDLFAVTQEPGHLDEARRRLDWLLERASGGSMAATVPEEAPRPKLDAWPLRRSIHLGKMALPLLKGWRVTEDSRYRDAARRLFEWALALQRDDGRFAIDERNAATMTHPHCYVTEALLYGAWSLDDDEVRAAVDHAVAWLAEVQNPDGSFYRWYDGSRGPLRTKVSDATAQALRIWRVTGMYPEHAARAADYLDRVAMKDGGLPNYVRSLGPLQWRKNEVCSWPTFFWHHALTIESGDAKTTAEIF
jgi:uncharacterized protein YyaL (SSP411 family)